MKKILLTLTVVGALASTVYGQGRVGFASAGFNASDAITISSLNMGATGGTTGQGIGGDKYTVQLVWSAGSGLSQAAFDAARTFGQNCTGVGTGSASAAFFAVTGSTGTGGGFFDAGTIPNPVGTSMPGGPYTAQVYAWYSGGGATSYAQALSAGVNIGKSGLFNINSTVSPTPFSGTPFVGFQVGTVPEPSSLALAGLGAVAMLLIRRKK